MRVWGARVRPPNLNRALAAFLLNAGLMGREERRLLERIVSPGQRVVDVGANQGIFTLLLSRLVGPEGRVVALEPAPDLFAALDENCRVNGAANVTRLRAAAGRARSEGVLHCSRFNSGDNRLSASLTGAAVPVSIVPLDEILTEGAVDLVKIDVQGYELHVVHGMEAVIDRSPGLRIFFEFWPAGLGYAGSAPDQLLDFFVVRRFSLYELAGGALRRVEAGELMRTTKAGDWSWRNFLAVRE